MTPAPLIRDERPGDIAQIAAITTAAFAPIPYSSHTEARIVDALRDAGALTVSLVAEEAGDVLGHVAFSPVLIDGADCGWFGLGPVSVRPDRQGAGIGSALIREGLARLNAMSAGGCVLLGDPRYYQRFGFVADPALTYPGGPAAAFQSIVIAGPARRGVVAYHAGFDVE